MAIKKIYDADFPNNVDDVICFDKLLLMQLGCNTCEFYVLFSLVDAVAIVKPFSEGIS